MNMSEESAVSKFLWVIIFVVGLVVLVQVVRGMPDAKKLIEEAISSRKDECGGMDKKACEWLDTLERRQKGCDAGEKGACRFLEAVKRGEASQG